MQHFLLEVILVVAAVVVSFAMLRAGFRTYGDGHPVFKGLLALTAWVAVWLFTYKLWLPLTGHRSHVYTNRMWSLSDFNAGDVSYWFALLFWLGVILLALSALPRLHALVGGVRSIGFILVFVAFFQVGYFLPGDDNLVSLKESIQSQLDATNKSVEALHGSLVNNDTAQKKVDAQQNARLDALEKEVKALQDHDQVQDKNIAALKASIKQVQDNVVNMTPSPRDLTTPEVAQALAKALSDAGWKAGDVRVGTIDWSKDPIEAGTNAFNHRITTRQELVSFLNGNSAQSRAARAHLKEALPESEWQRALSGEGFVPVQFNKQTCYSGNGYFLNGAFHRDDGKTCRAAGDVWWVYVDSKVNVVWDASVRADCGNGGLTTPPSPVGHVSHPRTPTPTSTTNLPPTHHTSTPPPTHHTSTSSPGCLRPSGVPPSQWDSKKCQKKSVSRGCSYGKGSGCAPNGGLQPGQHNTGQPTGTTTGAPATPTSSPSASTAPGGSSGTATGTPTGTSTCDASLGCGGDHSSPTPTTVIP